MKKIAIYGDSISTNLYGEGGYEQMLFEKMNLQKIYNHAVAASGITATTPNNTAQIVKDPKNLHEDIDYAIIWHGTNDWYWGAKVGEKEDTTDETFCGALNNTIQKIRETAKQAKIFLLTPLFRFQAADGCEIEGDGYATENKIGETLERYYQAVLEIAKKQYCCVIDMRTLTNFNRFNWELYQPDGVHPSKIGYERISEILKDAIK